MRGSAKWSAAMVALVIAGCEPAEDVEVLPLPPLERPTPEARAGLPEVSGVWNFAGWELAQGDSASLQRDLARLGAVAIQTQRLDSLAGFYAAAGARLPLVGEVRRGGVVSLVTLAGALPGRFLAGHVASDTLWMQQTTLLEPGSWPSGARVAFVRQPVAQPFVRLHGAVPPAPVDSLADSLGIAADSGRAAGVSPSGAGAPVGAPGAAPQPAPAAGQPRPQPQPVQPVQPAPRTPPVRQAPPQTPTPEPRPQPQPEPEPQPPEPDLPPLLGDPVAPDTSPGR